MNGQNGKGSKRRPRFVSNEEYNNNYNKIFKNKSTNRVKKYLKFFKSLMLNWYNKYVA